MFFPSSSSIVACVSRGVVRTWGSLIWRLIRSHSGHLQVLKDPFHLMHLKDTTEVPYDRSAGQGLLGTWLWFDDQGGPGSVRFRYGSCMERLTFRKRWDVDNVETR